MKNHTEIHLLPGSGAMAPRLTGVNLEMQEHAEKTNLWDWLADSGFHAARQFHPELNLRRFPVTPGQWGTIADRQDYENRRNHCRLHPNQAFAQEDFVFSDQVPWLGVPDKIIRCTIDAGLTPIVSVGAYPRMFPRSIIPDGKLTGPAAEADLDWEAAAALHEYAFALIWNCASEFEVTEFTTINEPENQLASWYFPERLQWLDKPPADAWKRLFRDDDQPTGDGQILINSLADQYAVTARIVRDALEDVRSALQSQGRSLALRLHGPTNVVWKPLWEKASPFLDSLDVHHYHPDPATMRRVFKLASAAADHVGKPISTTEFNRRSGGSPLTEFPFNLETALETVRLYLQALHLGSLGPAHSELVCLYLFSFPSTHRNYKHLIYGDMNVLDWSGQDQKPWGKSHACYPSFDEQQLRHPTPAYRMIRMIQRSLPPDSSRVQLLDHGLTNPTSAGPDDIHFDIEVHAWRSESSVDVFLLNPRSHEARGIHIPPTPGLPSRSEAVIRVHDQQHHDQATSWQSLDGSSLQLTLSPQSFTHIHFPLRPLPELKDLQIHEMTATPGHLLNGEPLELLQTSRLALQGIQPDGETFTIPPVWINWTSSCPEALQVEGSGLVLRRKRGAGDIQVTARTINGQYEATLLVKDDYFSSRPDGPSRHLGTVGLGEV